MRVVDGHLLRDQFLMVEPTLSTNKHQFSLLSAATIYFSSFNKNYYTQHLVSISVGTWQSRDARDITTSSMTVASCC